MTTADERRTDQPSDRRRAPRGGRRDTDAQGRHPTLLIADADSGARRPCVRYLARHGFLVDEANGGDEATSAVEMVKPRLVLMDAALPAARRFVPSVQAAGIPLIVMTTDFMDASAGDAAGRLVKPFPLDNMLAEVRRVLRLLDRQDAGGVGSA